MDEAITVPPALEGERLDRSLALLYNLSRSQAARLISAGSVSLNRKLAASASKQLHSGDKICVTASSLQGLRQQLVPEPEVKIDLVHEDDDLIVINKPSGLVVHPGARHAKGTLAAGLLARFPEIQVVGEPGRPGIVHRLDKGTSGLMAVARSMRAYEFLKNELANRKIQRHYLAICAGEFENERGLVDAPIGKSTRNPTLMQIMASGRAAKTFYQVKERFRGITLVLCQLETGRTHQIRVHLAAIGHPLLGDVAYNPHPYAILELQEPQPPSQSPSAKIEEPQATTERLRAMTQELQAKFSERPALHSCFLSCRHPTTKQEMSFSSTLPQDMKSLIEALRQPGFFTTGHLRHVG